MLRQFRTGEGLSDAVVADVGDLAQTVEQTERLQDAGVDANADTGIAGLDSLKCGPGREGPFRNHRHRQPSATTGVMDVSTEFAQHSSDGCRRGVWSRHMPPLRYILLRYVARRLHYDQLIEFTN